MDRKKLETEFPAALGAVLDYLGKDEAADFAECGQPENHIFRHLQTLREWLDEHESGPASCQKSSGVVISNGETEGVENMRKRAFPLGKISASREVLETVNFADICAALDRHEAGDWGEILPEIKIENGHALVSGGRLASAFRDRRRVLFWVFTNGARTETRVELAVW
jgi:hypothetical protein